MRRIGLAVVLALAVSLVFSPFAVEAQQAGKVYRIGGLGPGTPAAAAPLVAVFKQALHERGYVEGKNLVMEFRYGETAMQLAQNAEELTRLRVDVVVVTTTTMALAMKRATATIPIVMISVGDPVQAGLVESLGRPGGNVTGNAVLFPELTVKQLEFMKEALGKASRVLVFGNDDLEATLTTALERQRPDALLVLADPLLFFRYARIAGFALSHKLPSIAFWREFATAGGLISYGPNLVELIRRSTWYIDEILKGAKPAELPAQQPTKFDLIVNLKTAKALGLNIPQSLLLRADQVIE